MRKPTAVSAIVYKQGLTQPGRHRKEVSMPSPHSIRGLDPKLVMQARIEALKQGVPLGKWLNEAIAMKLTEDETLEINIYQHPI